MTRPKTKSTKAKGITAAQEKVDPPALRTPRLGSKAHALIHLLQRPEGSTIEQLTKTSGWMPHSVRGFLAGTLKRYALQASSEGIGKTRVYRIAGADAE
jgi:hypothetical protein